VRRKVKVSSRTMNAVNLEKFVDIELSTTLTFLVVARKDRRAGNVTAANREELGAHRAYQEALHLFRVLRSRICQTGARRLAIRIREIGNAMRRLAPPVQRFGRPALIAVANPSATFARALTM
jgi:hypothetical protein